jgi:intracellular septation protein A
MALRTTEWETTATSEKRQTGNPIVLSLLINALGPLILYGQLRPHMSEVHALMCTALIPLVENMITLGRYRKLDAFGVFVLTGIVLTTTLVLLGGSPRLILIRESLLGAAFGIAMLVSLVFPRPLLFSLVGHFVAGYDPEKRDKFNIKWASADFRRFMYLLTVTIGVGTLLEATIRTYLVFHLSTLEFLRVSPFVHYGIAAAIVLWVIGYERSMFLRTGQHPFALNG